MRILHLSDLHFGERSDATIPTRRISMHRFRGDDGRPDPAALPQILARDNDAKLADIVIISGDLGWSGSREDYKPALAALRNIQQEVCRDIVLCPGNHDVSLDSGMAFLERQAHYEEFVREFYGDDFETLYPAFSTLDDTSLTRRERLLSVYESDDAQVVSVNSAALQDVQSTPIALTQQVLAFLERSVTSAQSTKKKLRVFCLHHHLFPFVENVWSDQVNVAEVSDRPDPTILSNAARVQHWLTRNGFDLVLHGHKHIHHGREDRLWRPSVTTPERRLVIVGAGSAGVSDDQRAHSEPLSYNLIDVDPTSSDSWRVAVQARSVDEGRSPVAAIPWFQYAASAGSEARERESFYAYQMDDCHRQIAQETRNRGVVRNFISLVEDSEYVHPPTAENNGIAQDSDQVNRAFMALHPEYSSQTGWEDEATVDEALRHRRERLEHGSRLFRKSSNGVAPIASAIQFVEQRPTWAYVGLYRPTLDTDSHPRPMPGLMSIQFIKRSDEPRLDAVATFRNLELSFWWVVNMLEIRRLLEYSAARCGRPLVPGSVTMFAALAEWKRHPDPVYAPRLDEMDLGEMLSMCTSVRLKSQEQTRLMAQLLEEKADTVTPTNVETEGLRNLLACITAAQQTVRRGSRRDLQPLFDKVQKAKADLTFGDRTSTPSRTTGVQAARSALRDAAHIVREVWISHR